MVGAWLRSWKRSPLATGQFLVTIAIGMGAVAALVSLMLALGYLAVWERVESGATVAGISGGDLSDFSDATHNVFDSLGAFAVPQLWLFDQRGATRIRACSIQANVFSDLGIRPVLGRGVRPDDDVAGNGAAPVVWISYRLWLSRYGGSPSIIGATVGLGSSTTDPDEQPMRIVGVLPPGISIPLPFMENTSDVWYLIGRNIAARSRQSAVFFGVGRLRPGVSASQAQAALATVAKSLEQQYSSDWRKRPVVQGLEDIAQDPARQTMGLLALGVGLVFLVGCVNLAILMGAEGRGRQREIAIRIALGADRWRLWQEVAAEKCLLTLLSLGLGVAFAYAMLRVLTQLMPAAGLGQPLPHPPLLNLSVLLGFAGFAFAAALVWSALLVAAADGPESSCALAASGSGLGYAGLSDSSPGANS